MFETIIFLTVFLLTFIGVGQFRRWSLRKEFLDVPNERSSHITPTPRGGGIIIVFICLISYLLLSLFFNGKFAWSYFVGAVLIAFISWLDDLYSVSFVWRFLIHSTAACLIIFEIGFWNEIYLPVSGVTEFGLAGAIITFLWIVWLTNAYNFMDGIDGIAGMQAFTAGIGWLLIGKIIGIETTAIYGGVVAFSALGFLMHNWQPAKIFMGDVGSAFLGFTFACLPLISKKEDSADSSILPLIAVLLVWLFIFDSIFTFCRRLLKKQKVWTAHREHFYQRMIIGGRSHAFVASLYGILSMILGFSIILWITSEKQLPIILLLICLIEAMVIFLLISKTENVDERGE